MECIRRPRKKDSAMKKHINKLKDNTVQILETLILIVEAIVPFVISTKDVFKEYLAQNTLSPDNFVKHIPREICRSSDSCWCYFVGNKKD